MKTKQLGRVLLTVLGILIMYTVGGMAASAGTDFELVMAEYDGDLYYVEKTERFDLKKPIGVAVALGGGGARALVNVGVLKALEEEQIPIDLVIGTSMGAIVAVLYGSGMSIAQIEQLVTEVNLPGMFYVNFPFNKSLISTKEINHFIEKVIPVHELGEFPIPTALLSHDLTHGVRYIATTGRAAKAVGGPYAIPLCFPGEKVGESFLIDAGVWELTPAEAARVLGAQVVIATEALDVLPFTTYDSPLRSWARMINLIKEENAVNIVNEYSDVVISHEVGDYSFMDFHLAKSFIDLGYHETKKQIPEIRRILGEKEIALRNPAQKYSIPMADVLRDVRHDRQVLDPFVMKPVYYYGKDHSLTARKLFRSPLYRTQLGFEVEYQNLNGLLITQGTGLDNLELGVRWKKLLPQVDLAGYFKIAPGQEDWEVELRYFLEDLMLGAGYTRLAGKDYLHLSNQYGFKWHSLTMQGETDLLVNAENPADYRQYEFVTSTAGKVQFTKELSLQPKVVVSNSQILNTPRIYRGNLQEQFSKVQSTLELVYEKRFPYSLEIIQVIQMVGVEYSGFIDYRAADEVLYAVGAGVSADVNLLGIKPSRIGGYLAYEPVGGSGKFGFDLDVTF